MAECRQSEGKTGIYSYVMGQLQNAPPSNINLFMATTCRKPMMFLFTLLAFSVMQARGLTVEQSFVFDASGGMRVTYAYEVPNRWAGFLTALQKEATDQMGLAAVGGVLDEDAVRRQFSDLSGVYVENYSLYHQLDESRRVEFTVVALDAGEALQSGVFGPIHFRGPTAEKQGCFFELAMPEGELSQKVDAAHAQRLAELLDGFECTLKVTTPTPVQAAESTGTAETSNRRAWRLSMQEILSRQLPTVRISW